MNSLRKRIVGGTAVGMTALTLLAVPAGVAANDGDIIRTGNCSAGADWKLKLSPENGRIEVEFEVDQNINGRVWNVSLKRNGNTFFTGQRTTQAPSGSFEVRRVTTNGAGPDTFVARAVDQRTGQVCRGSATF
ncbi:MAG TPA: hypothetical protein VMZ33_06265 [Candidatus Limnocylindrales bacterium]|nr:hypothetical protein [Candidatus Limnocylindrales bacterium]